MHIDIQARDFSLTDALRDYAENRLRYTLTSTHSYIQKIVMRLSDINGPRGGADKRCHIKVVLTAYPDVVIEDVESDMYAAINRASHRAGRSVVRKINRMQTLHRKGGAFLMNAQ